VFLSVDAVDGALAIDDAYEVPFPLLSDPDATVLTAYNVANEMKAPAVDKLAGMGFDVERWSKRKHHKIAIPAMFLIDEGGIIRFAHASRDHRTRPDEDALLAALAKLRQPAP
jgi:peroxiredoxin